MVEDDRPGRESRLPVVVELVAFLVGLCIYVYLAGLIADWIRLSAARLPIEVVNGLPAQRIFSDGLRLTALTGVVFALACLLAWLAPTGTWSDRAAAWHEFVKRSSRKGAEMPPVPGEGAALGETAVRIVAGFNILVASALLASAAAVLIEEYATDAWWAIAIVWVGVFALVRHACIRLDPGRLRPGLHRLAWGLVALVAVLFASAPLGVLVLANVAISALGPLAGAQLSRPGSTRAFLRSPLPWLLAGVVALIGFAFEAVPPVSFPAASLTLTAGAEQAGGLVGRSGAGVYLATCTRRIDGSSKDERVRFVPTGKVESLTLGGPAYDLDSQERPSLATLALRALGLRASVPTWVSADLKPRRPTCGEEVEVRAQLLHGAAPPEGRARDGEQPVQQTTPQIAALARLYQPTVEVSAADRFWPVSLGAVLAEAGSGGQPACLVRVLDRPPKQVCPISASSVTGRDALAGSDYLQLPEQLGRDPSPERQFEAFERGQHNDPGSIESWLAEPRAVKPWESAQIYFYDGRRLRAARFPAARPRGFPSTVDALEYWFYYPYNYFPLKVRSNLMTVEPIAADRVNIDFHQGDWEHVDVLLEAGTSTPIYLYLARHAGEGVFIPWAQAVREGGQTHPVVQAAYGGHPSYPPGCGQRRRPKTGYVLSDWLVCGPMFVFEAEKTPLVDIGKQPWACWPGYFGEARPGGEVRNAAVPENVLDRAVNSVLGLTLRQVLVGGPKAPLLQAENTGVCRGDPAAEELAR